MTDDRRDPNAAPAVSGRRRTDPTLTTRDCADRLGVSTDFIIGEIRDGRLIAVTDLHREGKRGIYRISEADFEAFMILGRWRPKTIADTAATPDTRHVPDPSEPPDEPAR